MAHASSAVTLATMPVELLGMIIEGPRDVWPYLKSANKHGPGEQGWLAIKTQWVLEPHEYEDYEEDGPEIQAGHQAKQDRVRTIRALSNVCKRLREVTLPLLWKVCQVSKVSELGRLRETFRVNPSLALHVRHFAFPWDGDEDAIVPSREEANGLTAVDLAFFDRVQAWHKIRVKLGCKVLRRTRADGSRMSYFQYEGVQFLEPEDFWRRKKYPLMQTCEFPETHLRGWGPDHAGPDSLVPTPTELDHALVEVTAQLTCLDTFVWKTSTAPMPTGVFRALEELSTLSYLHVTYSQYTDSFFNLPVWTITPRLKGFSIEFGHARIEDQHADCKPFALELPVEAPKSSNDRLTLNLSLAYRAVIAAVTSGPHLTHLNCTESAPLNPLLALREWMPYWVQIEEWGWWSNSQRGYLTAASTLRQILAHASRWLNAGARQDRTLTGQDVQLLRVHFSEHGAPWEYKMPLYHQDNARPEFRDYERPHIDLYLPWLEEDAELAQKVADAWNAVVQRGEADRVKCRCSKCQEAV